jgi:hypothetical protein
MLMLDSSQVSINSPANNYWTLYIQYTSYQYNETSPNIIPITFDSSTLGQIDLTRTSPADLAKVNTFLEPTRLLLGVDVTIFWKLVNWIIVGYYWTILNDLGQISPTIYAPIPPQPLPDWYQINFSHATSLPSTNNIFLNETLFDIYSTFLSEIILPNFHLRSPEFLSISSKNQLQPRIVTFVRSYTCQVRQWKSVVEAVISVAASIYVFTVTPFTILVILASIVEKRRHRPAVNQGQ